MRIKEFRLYILALVAGCFSLQLCAGQSEDFRLPRSIVPIHYTLQMKPILDETPEYTRFTSPGFVKITVNCVEETNMIKLHALDLTIIENSTRVTSLNDEQILSISSQTYEQEYNFFVITLVESLKRGEQYDISIQFIAPVSQTRLDGMYLDQYTDPATNATKYVATTLFAAINARRCFPCFDEPNFKANFSVSLARKDGYHSLSNMHQISTEPLPGMDGWYLDHFAPSLPMPTYLVAMIVSDMTYEQAVLPQKNNNVTIRAMQKVGERHQFFDARKTEELYPKPNNNSLMLVDVCDCANVTIVLYSCNVLESLAKELKLKSSDIFAKVYAPYYFIDRGGGIYAVNQTTTVLQKFDEYFDSSFMLQKLDSVSLPRFFYNAMENWALITYNDRVLLYFPGETTEQERYRITSIIAHEVVHHYFGNMVTCEWWTWIWLNEGSATYFSHLGVEMTYPEFKPWDRFISDVYQVAMEFDSSPQTHPVAYEPKSLAEIGGVYDDIAYEKGASLLRMMQSFLTEEVVQSGIRRYLKEKVFQNARQDDLFQVLQETAEQLNKTQPVSVKEIMDTWTLQSGFPLVRVSRISATEIRLTQEKYSLRKNSNDESNRTNERWWIPISISVIAPTPKEYFFWMSNDEEQEETIFQLPEEEIFVVNSRSEGYYRTLYSSNLLENLLLSEMGACKISSTAKAKLLDDYIALKHAGLANVDFEAIIDALCLENGNLLVWETVLKEYTRQLLETFQSKNFTHAEMLRNSMKEKLLTKMYATLRNLENAKNNQIGETMMLRSELLFWSCLLNPKHWNCIEYAEDKIQGWNATAILKGGSPFQADFEDTFLRSIFPKRPILVYGL